MNLSNRPWAALCAAMLPFLFASQATAQIDDADAETLAAYRLTDEGVEHFGQASRNLAAALEKDPGLQQALEGAGGGSIDETAAAYDAQPAVRDAIESADMTSKEYITFTYALVQAGLGAWLVEEYGQQELPEDTPRENVDYYLTHKEELAALAEELRASFDETE